MRYILLIVILASASALIGFPALELGIGLLILTPVVAFIIGQVAPLGFASYIIITVVLFLIFFLLSNSLTTADRIKNLRAHAADILSYSLVFLLNYQLALSWPDFFPMGERLRDYALLASSIHDPISFDEPWLPGYSTPYYLYWYRFGHAISRILALEVWEVYHFLNAWSLSLLWVGIYLLSRATRFCGRVGAMVVATVVAYGSNYEGLLLWWKNEFASRGWWSPSRVIQGAINEFPAWSFLLGDNHPHFLSYGITSLSLAIIVKTCSSVSPSFERTVFLLVFICFIPLLLFNANAWEAPLWVGMISTLLVSQVPRIFDRIKFREHFATAHRSKLKGAVIGLLGLTIICSLLLSGRNISSGNAPLQLVSGKAPFSTTGEILRHWGVPFFLLCISQLATSYHSICSRSLLIGGVAIALISNDAFPLILSLLATEISAQWNLAQSKKGIRLLVVGATTISALGLILLCELVFLDDPYGGENERMNTIFKCYAFSWPLLHFGSITKFWNTFQERCDFGRSPPVKGCIQGGVLIWLLVMCGFFARVATDQRPHEASDTKPEGLSRVDREFPGARATIHQLRVLPYGIVLEAQGSPYSWTSHVATLSGMPSYLGWANHVELLVKDYGEIAKRKENTRRWYTSDDCGANRLEMRSSNIMYVVVGPLEKQEYGREAGKWFSCLNKLSENGGYQIFKP
jgi:uncharacterized membrane protein